MTTLLTRALALGLLAVLSTGCVSRGFPTHGGGKRFAREQQLVSIGIDMAVDEIDFDLIEDAERDQLGAGVGLLIFSVADSGGGRRSGGGGGLGLFGFLGGGDSIGNNAAAGGVATVSAPPPTDYATYGFTSSEDLEYLKGKLVHQIIDSGLRFNPKESEASLETGMVVVTVGELGIDESSFNALLVSSNRLKARVQLNAYYVRQPKGEGVEPIVVPLFEDDDEGETIEGIYTEWYILGIGPVNDISPKFDDVDRDD